MRGRQDCHIAEPDDVYFDVSVLRRVVEYFQRYDEDIIYSDLAYVDEDSTIEAIDVRTRSTPKNCPTAS